MSFLLFFNTVDELKVVLYHMLGQNMELLEEFFMDTGRFFAAQNVLDLITLLSSLMMQRMRTRSLFEWPILGMMQRPSVHAILEESPKLSKHDLFRTC